MRAAAGRAGKFVLHASGPSCLTQARGALVPVSALLRRLGLLVYLGPPVQQVYHLYVSRATNCTSAHLYE